jgi:hypothetical protein
VAGRSHRPADAAADALARWLADPAVWVEARPSLERDVTATVRAHVDARERRLRHPRRRRRAVLAGAAAVIVTIGAATAMSRAEGAHGDFAARLRGTAMAPAAEASARITKNRGGFTVVFDARGLPRLLPGEFYEAWLASDAGTLVPIGTFSSDDSRITLWSGVSPHDFPTMRVTIERSDGKQSSSGRGVLTGTVHER